jgi:alpha/beta superfamily hydrolase
MSSRCISFYCVAFFASACDSSVAFHPTPTVTAPLQQASPIVAYTATPQYGSFYFKTDDGVTLSNQTFGQGATAGILSNQNAEARLEWWPLAKTLASRGYLVMTYDYRGIGQSRGSYIPRLLEHDLVAAIGAAQARGARKIVLIGASLGGLVTMKVAASVHPAAVVVLSAPRYFKGLSVDPDEARAVTAPRFFAVSSSDANVYADVQYLYTTSPEPKQLQVYPSVTHHVDLFLSRRAQDDFMNRLTAFLKSNAPV